MLLRDVNLADAREKPNRVPWNVDAGSQRSSDGNPSSVDETTRRRLIAAARKNTRGTIVAERRRRALDPRHPVKRDKPR